MFSLFRQGQLRVFRDSLHLLKVMVRATVINFSFSTIEGFHVRSLVNSVALSLCQLTSILQDSIIGHQVVFRSHKKICN
jgi:hypothetical protein